MRTNYLRHLANIIDIQWSRPVWGEGPNSQLNWLTCCKRQKSVVTLRLQTNMMQWPTRGIRWTSYTMANSISLLK